MLRGNPAMARSLVTAACVVRVADRTMEANITAACVVWVADRTMERNRIQRQNKSTENRSTLLHHEPPSIY